MKQDQNRIELRLNTAEYDECVLYANEGTRVLPGSLLVFTDGNVSEDRDPIRPNMGYANFAYSAQNKVKVTESVPLTNLSPTDPEYSNAPHLLDAESPYKRFVLNSYLSSEESDFEAYEDSLGLDRGSYPRTITKNWNPDRFPCAVVLENALYGKSLCHESPAGELVLCRYLTSPNEVLLRAVPGTYYYGDIVYAVQTNSNGIWVASEGTLSDGVAAGILDSGASLGMKVGICQEDYRITPAMCTIVDNTGPEDPTGYTSADRDVDARYAERYGASAIPEKLYGVDGFYQSNVSSSRYFAGAMLNLIKVRTTAFYASTTPLPTIEGVELPESVTRRYDSTVWDLSTLLPVSVDGADVSYAVEGGGEVRNRGDYYVNVTVSKYGYQTLTKRILVTILPQPLVVDVETNGPEWTRAADNTTDPIRRDLTAYTTGICAGDNITVYGTTATLPGSAAGTYENVQLFFTHTGSEKGNYYIMHENPWPQVTVTLTGTGPNPTGSDDPPVGLSVGYSSLGDTITYDGVVRPISDFFVFEGTEEGDDINYYVDGTLFGGEVPTVRAPGIYSVAITVDREGYAQFSETLPVTINKAHVTVSGSVAQGKTYDKTTAATITLGAVAGLVPGDDATVGYSASFASAIPGVQDVAVTYSLGGADIGNYVLDTANETLSAEITTKPFSITGTEIKEKVYDGTSAAEVVVGSVTGLIEGDDVTITGSAIFHTVTVGNYNITVHYTLTGADADKYYAAPQTRPTKIKPKQLTISGTTVADKTYDGTTEATITAGTLSGLVGSDTVNLTAAGSFPSAEVGVYDVEVSYSISGGDYRNYLAPVSDTISAEIIAAEEGPVYSYAAVANGGPTETTTEIAVNLISDDPSAFPASVSYADIEIGGDAVLNTDAESCQVAMGVMIIPVRMLKSFKDSYEITIKITAGNQDKQVKPIPAYFVSGYWGCYPCQLGGDDEPSVEQIVGMYGRNVLKGAKTDSVACTFAIDARDWNREVEKNGITGDDADINEAECGGYEFFLTCWDDASITAIQNEIGISQMAAFKPFTKTINGVEYTGVISVNCELPSGTSPYTFSLS